MSDSDQPKKVFRFSDAYPSDYLREEDLMGNEVTLTIKGWRYPTKQDVGKDGKPIRGMFLAFEEREKEFGLNVTNHRRIKALHGRDPNTWCGKKITLYPTTCEAFGDPRKACIRVKKEDPTTGKKPDLF
tara:strand:- start:5130 stop:5516 length:387 start_codon:yes stop_codon:yes gene_type:complete